MATPSTAPCVRCGLPVSTDWLGGLCPRCVSRVSLNFSPTTATPLPRTRLGDYELGEELGRGAMGAVYRARHVTLNQAVALKVVLAGEFAGEAARRRFLSEAEAAAQLDHPNLVRVLNYGEAAGRQFYAMELVEGPTLREALAERQFTPEAAARLVAKAARAVQHAHEHGLLHRDLKPGNVLLDAAGEPHVADFGLALSLGAGNELSVLGSPVGTPAYMAPELVRGARGVTVAADLWSLGALLYELLAGRPPFNAASALDTYRQILEAEPGPLPAAPRDLATIALRCLRKDPAQRYRSAAELADELDRWLRHEPIHARPAGPTERLALWVRRRPLVASLSALLLLATLGGTALLWRANRQLAASLAATRAAERHARESLHRALLAQIRARRGVSEVVSPEQTMAVLREIAETEPTLDTRNEAIIALAARDLARSTGTNQVDMASLVFRLFAPASQTISQACHLDFSPDGRWLLLGSHDGLHLWEVATGREVWSLDRPGQPWMNAYFEPDGRSLVYSARTFGIHRRPLTVEPDIQTGAARVTVGDPVTVGRPLDSTIQFTYHAGRDWLVALDRNPFYIVRTEYWPGGDPRQARPVAAGEPVTWITLSPDGRWAASTLFPAADVRVWDAQTARPVRQLGVHNTAGVEFTPDSRHLICREPERCSVWSTATWTKVTEWPADNAALLGRIRFTRDGSLLATLQGTDRLQFRRLPDWSEAFTLTTPRPLDFYDTVLSDDDRLVAEVTKDGQVFVWNLARLREELATMGLDWHDPKTAPAALQ